jgi:hypothetical protein
MVAKMNAGDLRVRVSRMRNGPSPLSKTGAVIPMRQVEATMIGASLNGPGCFPFLKAGWDGPPVHAGGFPSVVMIEAARRGRPLFLQRLLLFVYALLYGTRFFGSAGVVRPGCGICAGSAGVTARRGWSAGTRGALVHGAVLHRAFGRAWSNIALAGRAASGLRGLREDGGCCECEDAG